MGAEIPVQDHTDAVPLSGEEARRVFEGRPVRRAVRRRPAGFAGFAGFSWGQLGLGALLAGFALWAFWITGRVGHLAERRIVAVSLSGMVNDFLRTEARSGNSNEQVQADTARFLGHMQAVLGERAQRGETVIVGEAVIASSAPDITAEVRGEVGRRMMAGRSAMPVLPAPLPAMPGANPNPGANAAGTSAGGPPPGPVADYAGGFPGEAPASAAGQLPPAVEAPGARALNAGASGQ